MAREDYKTESWTTSSDLYNTTSSFGDIDWTTVADTGAEGPTAELTEAEFPTSSETSDFLKEPVTFITRAQPDFSSGSIVTSTSFRERTDGSNGSVHNIVNLDDDTYVLELSKIMFGPFCVILLLTTAILLFLILKHFKHLIRLYLSLIFYCFSQLFLFAFLTIFAVLTAYLSLSEYCDAVNTIEYLALSLPGYGILLVSIARWVCVAYPTQYKRLLNPKIQIGVMMVLVALLALTTSLPMLGLCSNVWIDNADLKMGGFCHLGGDECHCTIFKWILVSVGFIVPFVGVLVVYCLIVNLLIKHKKKEKSLGKCKGSEKASKVDYNYKPVTIGEKLAQLKAIGQDAIPWSILLILTMDIFTTLPWIPQIFFPDLYLNKSLAEFLALDLIYTVMLAAISFSPAVYFLTTPVMRGQFLKLFSKKDGNGKFSVLSKNTESSGVGV